FFGWPQRLLRPGRPVLPLRRRQGVHRGPAQARARDLLGLCAVGQLLQAARARLRGARVCGLVAPQPLRAAARAAVSPRPRALGEHMFNRYVEIKRQEWDDYRVQVTRWELERYLSIL